MTSTSTKKVPVVSVSATPKNVDEGSQLGWNFNLTQPAPTGGLIYFEELLHQKFT